MVELDISFCGLRKIPDAIGCLRWLERLDLGGNNFVTLPSLKHFRGKQSCYTTLPFFLDLYI
jgi:Leucine-rich repeat (LRR) protein